MDVMLLPPNRPTLRRRLSGMAVSVPLHIALLALIVLEPFRANDPIAVPSATMKTITAVTVPPAAPPSTGDRVLTEEHETLEGDAEESVHVGRVDIEIAKVRARRSALFPFLTLDLMFLEPLKEDLSTAQPKMLNPFSSRARSKSTPPLVMADAAFQEIVDRSWSRRSRWQAFSEIAALVEAHDANQGRGPELMRAYLDQNILQPFCDDETKDPRFWAMLDNAADHADFIDFVRSYTRRHPSSRSTTELLFLLDELAQGSRDALLMLLDTKPNVDLRRTSGVSPEGFELALWIRQHYGNWLLERGLGTSNAIRARYDDLRLRLLSTIIESTPDGYRAGDARFLAGEILFRQSNLPEAERWWRAITPDTRDSYEAAYSQVVAEVRAPRGPNPATIARALQSEYGRWRLFNVDRLGRFGYSCSTF